MNPPRQIRLDPQECDGIKKASEATRLPESEVIRQLIRAALGAIRDDGYAITLPLKFQVRKKRVPSRTPRP
jgi:hypothetical protein